MSILISLKMAEGNPPCSFCLEICKDPVTISCNHVFCSGCIKRHEEKNSRKGSFTCPLCNREMTVAPQVISHVKKEDTHQRDVSKEEIYLKCDVCGPNISATSRCLECDENYCHDCSVTHLKMKASRNHTLYKRGLLDHQENVTLHRREFCTKHPEEEIKIVCKTCKNVPLCIFCKISEHDNHTSQKMSEEVSEIKNTLEKIITHCAYRLEQLQICTKEAESFDSKIDKFEQEEIKRIEEQEMELIRLLENKKENIKQEAQHFRNSIRLIYEKVRTENDVCKKQLAKEFSDSETLKTKARNLTHCVKESQIVQSGWYLKEDFLVESKRSDNIKLLDMQPTAFTPSQLSMKKLELTMGAISNDILKEKVIRHILERLDCKQITVQWVTGSTSGSASVLHYSLCTVADGDIYTIMNKY